MQKPMILAIVWGMIGSTMAVTAQNPDELDLEIELTAGDTPCRTVTLGVKMELESIPDTWNTTELHTALSGTDGEPRLATAFIRRGTGGRAPRLEVEWVEPILDPGSKLRWSARIRPFAPGETPSVFEVKEATDGSFLLEKGRPVIKGMNRFDPNDLENTKKVFDHVWDPSGQVLLTKGPGGKFPHHRGIFLGWKQTRIGDRKWDSWHMPEGDNTQRCGQTLHFLSGDYAQQIMFIAWNSPAGEVYLEEARVLYIWASLNGERLIDVASGLSTASHIKDPIHLDGDMQHAGLQFRASNEVAADTEQLTEFIFPSPDGEPPGFVRLKYPDDSVMGKDPRWVCMLFTVGGRRFGVLYMCHPRSKRPAEFSIRYYGRFGEFFPYTLAAGERLHLHYRFFVFEGERDPEYLEAVYQGFAHQPETRILKAEWKKMKGSNTKKPRTFLIDPEGILLTKKRIAENDPELEKPFEALRAEADEALQQKPVSVTDKETVPPSGDKHDYMSMGSYWWPNPDTPDGLPYLRRDGYGNPEGKKLDTSRLRKMCSAVNTLTPAYYFTGHEPYAEHAATLLRTWFLDPETKMNPHLEYAQGIPGICEGRGIGIIDTAHSFAELVDSVGLLERSDAWTDADQEALQEWFRQFLNWLLESEKGKDEARQPNNHGTWYDVQAAAIALFLGQPETARGILETVPEKRISSQIEPDGRQPWELRRTKSFGYSTMNLAGFFEVATLGERVGVDLWTYTTEDGRSIRKALDYLLQFRDGSKEWPDREIKGLNWSRYPMLLRRAANAYGEPEYEGMIAALPEIDSGADRFHLLYPRL